MIVYLIINKMFLYNSNLNKNIINIIIFKIIIIIFQDLYQVHIKLAFGYYFVNCFWHNMTFGQMLTTIICYDFLTDSFSLKISLLFTNSTDGILF